MRPRVPIALLAACLCSCATSTPQDSAEAAAAAIEIEPGGTPPIYFEKVLVRLPAGTVYGRVYDRARPSRPAQELVHSSKHMETEEFNIMMSDRLAELGYDAVDPTDAVFTPGSTVMARFRIVGVITDLQLDTHRDLRNPKRNYQTAELDMEVRLYDAAVKDVVYAKSFSGRSRDDGTNPFALPKAVTAAVDGALADPDFVERVIGPRTAEGGDSAPLTLPPCTDSARLPDRIGDASKAVVTIRQGSLHGSGVLVSPDGYVLTAAHIVSPDHPPVVSVGGVVELEATVERIDRALDVALLKIPGTGHRCLPLHDGEEVQVGIDLFAIGAPLDDRLFGTVTRGIVSGRPTLEGRELLQTDASLNPGSSGGPVLSKEGRVLGVVTSKYLGFGVEGVGFAIPADVIRGALQIRGAGETP